MRRSRRSGLGLLNIFELLEETLRRVRVRSGKLALFLKKREKTDSIPGKLTVLQCLDREHPVLANRPQTGSLDGSCYNGGNPTPFASSRAHFVGDPRPRQWLCNALPRLQKQSLRRQAT